MPQLKCPQCAREVPAGAAACPWDGTPINSVVVRNSVWGAEKTELRAPEETHTHDTDSLPALLPGQKLGDYEVRAVLGSGGMGEVYAGEQPMIGKKVAIKVLKSEVAADPANVQRMLSEARAVNAIRHRGIVDIFNFGNLPDGRPYLVMEYLEGTPLDVMLRQQGALIPPEATEFLEEICSALSAAHQRGIVHRDLKPPNVFIVGDARSRYVKLLDFGLAKGAPSQDAQRQTRAGMVVGTPDYIAPEQARGGTITPRTDLYSLGVMAYEMLTGSLPFTADSVVELMMMHVQAPPPRVREKIDFCPPALDALVYAMMQKEPADRPRSAEQVRVEIARIRRELREGETITGASSLPDSVKDTIRIPTPKDLPQVKTEPYPPPARRASRPPAPKTAPIDVPPTARYESLHATGQKRSKAWLGIAAAAVLAGGAAAGWSYFLREPPALVTEMPPATTLEPEMKVVQPELEPRPTEPAPLPQKAQPARPAPKTQPKAGPTREELEAELKAMRTRLEARGTSPSYIDNLEKLSRDEFGRSATATTRATVIRDVQRQK